MMVRLTTASAVVASGRPSLLLVTEEPMDPARTDAAMLIHSSMRDPLNAATVSPKQK